VSSSGLEVLVRSKGPEWQDEEPYCAIQAGMAQFWGIGSVSWIGIISLDMAINIRNPFHNTQPYTKFYHLFVWTYAVVSTLVLLTQGGYGPTGDGKQIVIIL
jgi:hypothetical protein